MAHPLTPLLPYTWQDSNLRATVGGTTVDLSIVFFSFFVFLFFLIKVFRETFQGKYFGKGFNEKMFGRESFEKN